MDHKVNVLAASVKDHQVQAALNSYKVSGWALVSVSQRFWPNCNLSIQKTPYATDLRSVEAHGTFLRDKHARRPGLEINRD
jgi:hypothetical protein